MYLSVLRAQFFLLSKLLTIGLQMTDSEILVTSLLGNSQKLDGGAMFGNAPKALWSRWAEPDELNRVPLACRCALVETNGLKVLLETGIGAYLEPKLADRFGVVEKESILPKSLEEAGLTPDDIDFVILSHLHFDHAGGLLTTYEEGREPDLIFKNAKFVVGKEAFERSKNPHPRDRASFISGLSDLLESSGRLIVLNEGESIAELPQFEFFVSHGHTPGQMHTIVHGETQELVYCGDLIPGTSWVHLPITMGYDRFPEQLIEEKEALYMRAKEETLFFFTHDSEYAASTVEKNVKGRFEPARKVKVLDRHAL